MKNNIENKRLRIKMMCTSLSVFLGVAPLIGCAYKEESQLNKLSSIYSYGNTFLSEENRQRYEFSREKIRVFYYNGENGIYNYDYNIIIMYDQNDGYLVSPDSYGNHFCQLRNQKISYLNKDGLFYEDCTYVPLDDILTDDEKEKESFYIEELVEIQNRMKKHQKELSLKQGQ